MQIALRPANIQDFEYCKRLYFAGMKRIIEELHLNMAAQAVSFRDQWALTEVRIITLDSSDVGWLQSKIQDDGLFIAQLFVDGPFQRKGIGTQLVSHAERALTRKGAVKINLQIIEGNESISAFYSSLGFLIEKRISMGKPIAQNIPA
jgi:ribosomal protein S18 acetylase RimI-like enzyme